jgi:hypothetical protein
MNTTTIILTVAAVAVVAVASVAFSRRNPPSASAPTPTPKQRDDDFPHKPKWKPNVSVDIDRTIKAFAYYTDSKRSFAVFTNGTCVLLPDGAQDPEAEARKILDAVYNYHPDFNSQTMDDGNFLVSYSQPAFFVVFSDELAANRAYIDQNHLDGVVRDEVLLNAEKQPNKFDDRGKVGLFGRARMFLDAQAPKVIRVWKPH